MARPSTLLDLMDNYDVMAADDAQFSSYTNDASQTNAAAANVTRQIARPKQTINLPSSAQPSLPSANPQNHKLRQTRLSVKSDTMGYRTRSGGQNGAGRAVGRGTADKSERAPAAPLAAITAAPVFNARKTHWNPPAAASAASSSSQGCGGPPNTSGNRASSRLPRDESDLLYEELDDEDLSAELVKTELTKKAYSPPAANAQTLRNQAPRLNKSSQAQRNAAVNNLSVSIVGNKRTNDEPSSTQQASKRFKYRGEQGQIGKLSDPTLPFMQPAHTPSQMSPLVPDGMSTSVASPRATVAAIHNQTMRFPAISTAAIAMPMQAVLTTRASPTSLGVDTKAARQESKQKEVPAPSASTAKTAPPRKRSVSPKKKAMYRTANTRASAPEAASLVSEQRGLSPQTRQSSLSAVIAENGASSRTTLHGISSHEQFSAPNQRVPSPQMRQSGANSLHSQNGPTSRPVSALSSRSVTPALRAPSSVGSHTPLIHSGAVAHPLTPNAPDSGASHAGHEMLPTKHSMPIREVHAANNRVNENGHLNGVVLPEGSELEAATDSLEYCEDEQHDGSIVRVNDTYEECDVEYVRDDGANEGYGAPSFANDSTAEQEEEMHEAKEEITDEFHQDEEAEEEEVVLRPDCKCGSCYLPANHDALEVQTIDEWKTEGLAYAEELPKLLSRMIAMVAKRMERMTTLTTSIDAHVEKVTEAQREAVNERQRIGKWFIQGEMLPSMQ